jgi:hypothetical protein
VGEFIRCWILKLYGYKMSSLEQKSIKVIELTGKATRTGRSGQGNSLLKRTGRDIRRCLVEQRPFQPSQSTQLLLVEVLTLKN